MTEKSQPRLISSASFDPRKLLPPVSSQIASSRFVLPWPFGPHREDLEILLDGQPARVFGSQGQQRSCVLAMKLAEATVVGDLFGEHPVLLLDDVLSELDDERQTYLLTRMGEHQTIVTTCDTAAFARTNGKIVMVKGGVVEEA